MDYWGDEELEADERGDERGIVWECWDGVDDGFRGADIFGGASL